METALSTTSHERRLDTALLLLRLVMGVVFVAHGAQKLFGAFGGGGIDGTAQFMEGVAGLQPGTLFAVLSGLIEFGGGLLLIVGLLTPLAGLAIAGNMVGAILTVVGTDTFFNVSGGFELELTLAAVALALAIAGPGRLSLDHRLGIDPIGRLTNGRPQAEVNLRDEVARSHH